jgi:hypothetical protein
LLSESAGPSCCDQTRDEKNVLEAHGMPFVVSKSKRTPCVIGLIEHLR